jgi:hypothetical protein
MNRELGTMNCLPEPIEIARYIHDPPYGWMSRYRAVVEDDRIALQLRINLKSNERIPLKDIFKVRTDTEESVQHYFNHRFEMVDAEGRTRPFMVLTEFTSESPDLTVRLHPGRGRSNLNHWFIEAEPVTRAHEIGHALGLRDEYIDTSALHRSTPNAPGVYRDQSLMGNFFAEGIDHAELKPRHGTFMANNISRATGIVLKAKEQMRVTPSEPPTPVRSVESLSAENEKLGVMNALSAHSSFILRPS